MNTKVLLVGIGGVGSEIVSELEKMTVKEKKENVRFVIMDTDANTIDRIQRDGFGGGIVKISKRITVGDYLEGNGKAKDWFLENPVLSWKPVTEGAGQVRGVSRLAFEVAAQNQCLKSLHDAVRELHILSNEDAESTDSAFRIIIVSTLAGGTGSGILLPLALYLRRYMMDTYKRRDVIIRGIFLMSDCLEMVVQDETERKSLRGNTYAAIKELDAFMKKADGYLDDEYDGIRLEQKSGIMEDKLLAYNFCYLFSARNQKSGEQISFRELKNYVARCVYAQILGPMQELNNSIEDNVLKSTMSSANDRISVEFNRYCSAGISMLQYPYEEILDYLTIGKILEVFSGQWMEIDREYRKEEEKQQQREREGHFVKRIPRGDFYISRVKNGDSGNPLIKQIKEETEGKEQWKKYLEELDLDIQKSYEDMKRASGLDEQWAECSNSIETLRTIKKNRTPESLRELTKCYDDLCEKYKEELEKNAYGVAARYFFNVLNDTVMPWHFLYWLKKDDKLIHINSVRYFIYCVSDELGKRREQIKTELEELEEKLKNVEQVRERACGPEGRWKWRTGELMKICSQYETLMESLEEQCKKQMKKQVYQAGIEKLNRISTILEKFYDAYPSNYRRLLEKQEEVYQKLSYRENPAVVYVGVEEKRLKELLELVNNYERDKDTNSKLSGEIFHKLWTVSESTEEKQDDTIREIFQKDCARFWKENLHTNYGQELDINVVEAILQEGERAENRKEKYSYLEEKLKKMWEQTIPYLQISQQDSQGQERNFCTYHQDIRSDNKKIEHILEKELRQRGGTDGGGEVDKYTLIFYKILYNLRAVDISEFSTGPIKEFDTLESAYAHPLHTKDGGITFKNYYEIVDMQEKTKLTPHIDKRWSSILEMPDLNENFTNLRQKGLYQAFYLGWLKGELKSEKPDENGANGRYSFLFRKERIPYPTLAEALRGLAGHPETIYDILHSATGMIERDITNGKQLEDSSVYNLLKKGDGSNENSIFRVHCKFIEELPKTKWNRRQLYYMTEAVIGLYETVVGYFKEGGEQQKTVEDIIRRDYLVRADCRKEPVMYFCKSTVEDVCRIKGIYDLGETSN